MGGNTVSGIIGMDDVNPNQTVAQGENPSDYVWSFNGIRPDGGKFTIDPVRFIMFCQEAHPEWIDIESGEILVMDIVLTKRDAELAGDPGLEGTVAVTIRPDLGYGTSWAASAMMAATRYPANPKVKDRFNALAQMLNDDGFDSQ